MTIEQIERTAERAMDRLDALLMRGEMRQAEYDAEVATLDRWACQQYVRLHPDIGY